MSAGEEFTGTLEQVEQEPAAAPRGPVVPVAVEGVVPVQITGARAGASFNKAVTLGDSILLVGRDQRRRVLRVLAVSSAVFIGTDQSSVAHGVAAIWPLGVMCPITHQDEVWVRPVTVDSVVSAMVENWAD